MANMFDENGNYNKTEWKPGDRITAGKLNKIEESLEAINNNDIERHKEADTRLDILEYNEEVMEERFDELEDLVADNKTEVDVAIYENNVKMDRLEQEMNEGIDTVEAIAHTVDDKIADADASMKAQVAEVEGDLEGLHAKDEELSSQLVYIEKKNNDVVNISEFGGKCEVGFDNTQAIKNAINYLTNGGVIDFNIGTYECFSSFDIPTGVILRGKGIRATVLSRNFTGDFIPNFGGKAGLENISIDGKSDEFGDGRGIIFTSNQSSKAHFLFSEIKNFNQPCLEFLDDAGQQFLSIGCVYHTKGEIGEVAAIKMHGENLYGASSRHFYNTESNGCTLFDFGASGDIYVSGGFTNGLIFGEKSNKIFINNYRFGDQGGRIYIKGTQHYVTNSVSAVPISVEGTHNTIDVNVPNYDILVGGNDHDIKIKGNRTFNCAWTTNGETQPDIGDGYIRAFYNRDINNVKVMVEIRLGSTTTMGSGAWRFSLPFKDFGSIAQICGQGIIQANSGKSYNVTCRTRNGGSVIDMFYINPTNEILTVIRSDDLSHLKEGDFIRFQLNYSTV